MAEILWPESGKLTLAEFEDQAGVRIGGKFVWPATPAPFSRPGETEAIAEAARHFGLDPDPALCEHGHTDRFSLCNQCEAREIDGSAEDDGEQLEQIKPLLAGLRDSAALFREYEQHHRRRVGSAHADDRLRKAKRNADMAARLEELLKPFDRKIEEEENDGA